MEGGINRYSYALGNPINWIDLLGLITDIEIANVIFNETRSLSGPDIAEARRNIAHAIINGDNARGSRRPKTAPTTVNVPQSETGTYDKCREAVRSAIAEREWNDPVNGAMNFNFRNSNSTATFYKMPVQTQVGPLNNSYPGGGLNQTGVYANTYGGR